MRAQVVILPWNRHYPQSQRPDITTSSVLQFLSRLAIDGLVETVPQRGTYVR